MLDRARTLVTSHLPRACTTAALAAALGVDRTTLYRALRQRGITPSARIREVRLAAAAERLGQGAPVTEAGQSAGYRDVSAFSRAFARHFVVAPSRWDSRPTHTSSHVPHAPQTDCNILQSNS